MICRALRKQKYKIYKQKSINLTKIYCRSKDLVLTRKRWKEMIIRVHGLGQGIKNRMWLWWDQLIHSKRSGVVRLPDHSPTFLIISKFSEVLINLCEFMYDFMLINQRFGFFKAKFSRALLVCPHLGLLSRQLQRQSSFGLKLLIWLFLVRNSMELPSSWMICVTIRPIWWYQRGKQPQLNGLFIPI